MWTRKIKKIASKKKPADFHKPTDFNSKYSKTFKMILLFPLSFVQWYDVITMIRRLPWEAPRIILIA